MRGRYIGESDPLYCINGRDYEIIGSDPDFNAYAVVDEVGADHGIGYLYDKDAFVIIDDSPCRKDLEQRHKSVLDHVQKEGFAGARFLRHWNGQDVYELFTFEQIKTGLKINASPNLIGYRGSILEKLSDKEQEEFLHRFGYWFEIS